MRLGFRPWRTGWAACTLGALAAASFVTMGYAASSLKVYSAISIPGAPLTSWDILFTDAATGFVTMADASHATVNVINARTSPPSLQLQTAAVFAGVKAPFNPACNSSLYTQPACLNGKNGPDGSLIVNHREIWAGDGDSTVKVLSINTGALLYTIPTGGYYRADELCVSPPGVGGYRAGLVVIANDMENALTKAAGGRFAAPFISFIDVGSATLIKQVPFDGTNGTPNATNGLKQCQWNSRTGTFWISVPEDNGPGDGSGTPAVAEISASTLSVIHKYDLGPGCIGNGATGLAIGLAPQMLVGGCGAIVNDGSTGGTKGSFIVVPGETGADEVDYNPSNEIYYQGISGPPGSVGIIEATTETAIPVGPAARRAAIRSQSIRERTLFSTRSNPRSRRRTTRSVQRRPSTRDRTHPVACLCCNL